MKMLLFVAVLGLGSTALAKAPSCAPGTSAVMTCKPTAKTKIVEEMISSVTVCTGKGGNFLAAVILGSPSTTAATVEVMTGGTRYTVADDGASFSVSFASGMARPAKTANVSFTAEGYTTTATYSCK